MINSQARRNGCSGKNCFHAKYANQNSEDGAEDQEQWVLIPEVITEERLIPSK